MNLKVRKNRIGKYNFLSDEETLSFILDIVDKDNNTIKENGVNARLELNKDIEPIEDPFNQLEYVYEECWGYANNVISATDYKKQCLLFAKIFQENYQELCNNRIVSQKEEIEKQILNLQRKLSRLYGYDDISHVVNFLAQKEIDKYQKWLTEEEVKLNDVKENTKSYDKISKRIKNYNDKINFYLNSLIKIEDD